MQSGITDAMGRPIAQTVPPTSFEPLTVYDKPSVALRMLLEGPTAEGLRNLALNPGRLSITQRETLAARLQASAGSPRGQSRFVDTVVGVATNPLVWLTFLMTAPAGALAKAGATIIGPTVAKGASMVEHTGMLTRLGFASGEQAASGTFMGPVLRHLMGRAQKIEEGTLTRINELQGLMKKHGLPHFTSEAADLSPAQKRLMRDIEAYVPVRLMEPDEQGYWVNKTHSVREVGFQKHTPILGKRGNKTVITGYEAAPTTVEEMGQLEKKRSALKFELQNLKRAHTTLATRLQAEISITRPDGSQVKVGSQGIDWVKAEIRRVADEMRALPEISSRVSIEESGFKSVNVGVRASELAEMAKARPELEEFAQFYKKALDEGKMQAYYRPDGSFDVLRASKTLQASTLNQDGELYEMVMGAPDAVHEGTQAMGIFNSDRVKNAVRLGRTTQGEYVNQMAEYMRLGLEDKGGGYFPRNVMEEKQLVQGVLTTKRVVDGADLRDLFQAGANRTKGLTRRQDFIDPEWHRRVHDLFQTPMSKAAIDEAESNLRDYAAQLAKNDSASHPLVLTPHRLDPILQRTRKDMGQVAMWTEEAPGEVIESQRRWANEARRLGFNKHSAAAREGLPQEPSTSADFTEGVGFRKGDSPRRLNAIEDWTKASPANLPVGGLRMIDYAEVGMDTIRDPHARATIRSSMNAVLKRTSRESFYTGQALLQAKKMAGAIADSALGKGLESMGGGGKWFVDTLRKAADPSTVDEMGRGLQGGLVKLLYSSHLGLNLASSLVNGMQPLTYGAMVYGWRPTMRAFVDSLDEMRGYIGERISKYGVGPITHEERLPLLRKHFKWADQMGVDLEFAHQMDSMLYNGRVVPKNGIFDRVTEGVMKTFEYSERMNRAWAANTVARAHQYAGRPIDARVIDQIGQAVRTFQFVSDPVSTPRMFQEGPLANPLLKMFMTFPTRSFYTAAKVLPDIFDKQDYWKGLGLSVASGLGDSALVYELGKGVFGADLSRGLYAASATDLFGGQKFLEDGNEWVPLPPIVSIPKDFLTGVAQGDHRAVADALLRTMPGGVALGRILQASPELPTPFSTLQKGSVGWSQPLQDGRVPVYSPDGRLVDFQSPSSIVFRSLGVDLGTGQRGSELDGYLAKQKTEVDKYRRQYVNSLLSQDYQGAARVQEAFGKKFKDPVTRNPLKITVTQAQMKQAIKMRQTPRPERMLNSISPDVRQGLGQALANTSPERFNVPADQLWLRGTASSRDRETPPPLPGQ